MEAETRKHIELVAHYLNNFAAKLLERAKAHDQSKLEDPEAPIFEEFTPRLRGSTYGTPEYFQMLAELKPALEHHYAHNRHHPEHYVGSADPIQSMNLIDLTELICDWLAATQRHENGDIYKSIDINAKRFNLSDQVIFLLRNTIKEIE